MKRALVFLVSLWAASARSAPPAVDLDIVRTAQNVGTGELFGGGDLRLVALRSARRDLDRALRLIATGADTASLCTATACTSGNAPREICHALAALSEPERAACRDFVVRHAGELAALNQEAVTPILLSSMPLTATGGTVAAVTRREGRGEIIFHYGTIQGFSATQLISLLGHELGHKLRGTDDRFVDDARPVPPFAEGRKLLDAAGAALAQFAGEHPDVSQAAPPLPPGVDPSAVCRLVTDAQAPWLLGLLTATVPEAPTDAAWLAARAELSGPRPLAAGRWLASERSRRSELAKHFRRLVGREPEPAELTALTAKLAAGETEPQVIAALLGDQAFLAATGAGGARGFLEAVFRAIVGGAPTAEEARRYLATVGGVDRPTLAYAVLTRNGRARESLVRGWFQEYLNRPPTGVEIAAWSARLKEGAPWSEVQAALLASPEFASLQTERWKPCPAATVARAMSAPRR